MKVLKQSETPGLGNKIEEMPFVGEFDGADAPIEGVKPDRNTGDSHQVDMITGVTISSKAVVRIINERIAAMEGLLAAFVPSRGAPTGGNPGEAPGNGSAGEAPTGEAPTGEAPVGEAPVGEAPVGGEEDR